jgi:hypothetical protein
MANPGDISKLFVTYLQRFVFSWLTESRAVRGLGAVLRKSGKILNELRQIPGPDHSGKDAILQDAPPLRSGDKIQGA